jgi:hypothetical protein
VASYTERVKDYLRKRGCHFDRQGKGDHEIWYSPLNNRKFPIDKEIRSRHTANGIIKQAGIDEKPF